eukprot:CAMPEP_0197574362 /NCGR_PEP_ID=MMETSP1326-20131121/104_1 /TAXON_ID=1155430 /ORGANISM="Genus nov. species nov., Strain RCC2288" /LENGTH=79 /DNA_ID=CAMNT_0043136919 /DNA_START=53 /DNA_END=292 /DNA_ORIENTATION=-
MGGGNGMKTKMSRDKNLAKAKAEGKGSQLATNAKAMNVQCKVCLTPFMCTLSAAKLKEHSDSKHPKSTFEACFPHLAAA